MGSPRRESGGCVLVALPDGADPAARELYLHCTTCSALVPIEATASLQPGQCPPSPGTVAASL